MFKKITVKFGRVLRATAKDGYVFKVKTVTREEAVALRNRIIKVLKHDPFLHDIYQVIEKEEH